ncbi:PREDICTED: carboxypeptidase B-like [Polistes canadensis]|uniref:carboxypeptidase B-like n=1 Tax=Polistes canadensis TaxID=91411 RepID=UPI000718D53A|nr:PREDICTED: carboxypeptidase B-like [Polistes canadensis]
MARMKTSYFSSAISSSSSHSNRGRKCWWSLNVFVVLAIASSLTKIVDSASVNRPKREFVIPDWIEIVEESSGLDDRSNVRRAVKIREAKITYDGAQLWRVQPSCEQPVLQSDVLSELQEIGLSSPWFSNDTTVDIMVKQDAIARTSRILKEKNLRYEVVINDLQRAINEENPPLSSELMEELEGRKGHRMEWSSYHRLDDIYGYLDFLAQTYPDVCSVMNIGNSAEGRPLKVLRISNGKAGVPALWIDGGIHAREWISPAAVTYIIDYLVENSESLDADYYILPVANPDGYEYTFTNDRLWRKNRRNFVGTQCVGVDLNRNFGYKWGGLGTSKNPCSDIFAGSAAFSEPETNAIKNFFEASAADFKAYLTFHSYGQYFLYPWGYDRRVPPDYADLDRIGHYAANAMKKADVASSSYTVGNSATTLYAAAGGSDDWAKAMLKIKYSYTIELRDTGAHGFVLPARYIVPTAKEALAAVQVIAEACKSL